MPAITPNPNLYIVCGAGISGLAATRWLRQQGKQVLLYDEDTQQLSAPAVQALKQAQVQITTQLTEVQRVLPSCAKLVVSPGIACTHPLLLAAQAHGVNTCSEVELGLRTYPGKIAAVTGTNGKSTVCAMLHHILQQQQLPSVLCGNIGTAVTEVLLPARSTTPQLVVELSSFQLEHTQLPPLEVAIFTNFTPSHLARHGDTDTYFALKHKLFAALAADGLAICHTNVRARLTTLPANLLVVDEKNYPQKFLPDDKIFRKYTLHDKCNAVMALLAAQKLSGLDCAQLVPHLNSWHGLPYRLQLSGYLDGQAVINDSKATDIAATLAALRAQNQPVLLIFGGTAAEALQLLTPRDKIAGILVFGEHHKELHANLQTYFPVQSYADLAALLTQLQHIHLSTPLLFSPACVSKPAFANFEVRGEFFDKKLANLGMRFTEKKI